MRTQDAGLESQSQQFMLGNDGYDNTTEQKPCLATTPILRGSPCRTAAGPAAADRRSLAWGDGSGGRLVVEALACRLSGDAERDRDLVPGPAVCPGDLDRLTQPGLVGA